MISNKLNWRFRPSPAEIFSLLIGSLLIIWYAWILDDAYVYFRYVDNLVIHRFGLVWNPNEFVEGFSSPAWVMLLSLLRAAHLDFWVIIRSVGIICFVGFWWLACLINRGLMPSGARMTSLNIPLLYISLTYAVSCYFTSGTESPLILLLAAVYAAAILWPGSRLLQCFVGFGPLVRPELTLPFLLFLLYAKFLKEKIAWFAILTCGLTMVPYMIFRLWYYADIFPNTFYLKEIAWPSQGLNYLYDTLLPYHLLPYLLGMGAIYFALRRGSKISRALMCKERLAMITLAIPLIIYVVKIGGDARHFRYLAYPFVLLVLSTGGLVERIRFPSRLPKILIFAAIALFAISNYPRQLHHHPISRQKGNRGFLRINDAAFHRINPTGITPPIFAISSSLGYQAAKHRYAETFTISTNKVPVITEGWCQRAYLQLVPCIQRFGLTDPFLARTKCPFDKPSHKFGLAPLADDIVNIREKYGFNRGAFEIAIMEDDSIPLWITNNIDAIKTIEARAYNTHHLFRNLMLAIRRSPQIYPKIQEE